MATERGSSGEGGIEVLGVSVGSGSDGEGILGRGWKEEMMKINNNNTNVV